MYFWLGDQPRRVQQVSSQVLANIISMSFLYFFCLCLCSLFVCHFFLCPTAKHHGRKRCRVNRIGSPRLQLLIRLFGHFSCIFNFFVLLLFSSHHHVFHWALRPVVPPVIVVPKYNVSISFILCLALAMLWTLNLKNSFS